MKIALLFGSFNPIHLGHLQMAEAAIAHGVDEVWFLPSPQNPLKDSKELIDIEERIAMVNLAISGFEKFKLIDLEKHLETPSYTYKTLQVLSELYSHEFFILCGTDVMHQLPAWKNVHHILENHSFLVCQREVESEWPESLQSYQDKFIFIPFEQNSLSASHIRLKQQISLIPSVDRYIREKHLYGF